MERNLIKQLNCYKKRSKRLTNTCISKSLYIFFLLKQYHLHFYLFCRNHGLPTPNIVGMAGQDRFVLSEFSMVHVASWNYLPDAETRNNNNTFDFN